MIIASTQQHKNRWRRFHFDLRSFHPTKNLSLRRFSVTEAAFLLLMAYIASKGLGIIRQILFNSLFGTGPDATAYYAAFRLPDTIFNLIAGGALTHALIPVLVSYEKEHSKAELWRLISLLFNILLVILTAGVLLAEFLAPVFVNNLLVPGLPAYDKNLTTILTRIMLLQPLILGLGTILTAILHSKRQFVPSALVIVLYDAGLIGGLLVARAVPGVGIYGPTFGLLVSAVCQVSIQIPPLIKQGAHYTFSWNLKHPGLHEIMRLLVPNMLSVAVASASAIVITSFASYLPDKSSIAAMHNAYLLFALPLTLVTQIIGVALLPQLTIQAAYRRFLRMKWTFQNIVGVSLLLSTIAAILLYVLGRFAIHILFQGGVSTAHAIALTNLALIGYAIGLPGLTLGSLTVLIFYALKDVRTPLFLNVAAITAQIGISYVLLKDLKGFNTVLTLPLVQSLTSTAQAIVLCLIMYARLSAKAKTDRSMQRLQQWRMNGPVFQKVGATQRTSVADQKAGTTMRGSMISGSQWSSHAPDHKDAEQLELRNVESAIDLLSTAPELQSVVPPNPHNILMMVQQHITNMTGPVVEAVAILKLLTQICQQLRYIGQRSYKLVIQEYTRAVDHYPDNAYVHFSLGTLEQQSGNYNKAINAFTQALSESTIEVITRYNIAQCLLYQGYPDLAIQQLLDALRAARGASNEAVANSVWAARPRKENEEDETPEREIFKLLEKADQRIQRLAQKQPILQLKQTSSTHSAIVKPEEMPTPSSPEAPTSSQEKLASTQDTATSHHEDLHEILEIEENSDTDSSIQIYDDEIQSPHYDGQTEHTLNELNGIVQLAPDDPRLHNELANTYLQRGLLDNAITELRVLTFIYLSSKQLRDAGATVQRISQIYAGVGDIEEALTNLRHALELVPDDVDILCQIIGFCQQLGLKKDAAQYQMALAHHYVDHRQFSEAATALQQVLAFDAKNYEAYDLLGQIYQLAGDSEQAGEVYRHLAKLHMDSSIAWNRKAALQESQMIKTG